MAAKYVCIVGRSNQPLYAAPTAHEVDAAASVRFLSVCFAALDMVEDRMEALLGRAASSGGALYLGQVMQFEQVRVYALVTNTHTKILLVCDEKNAEGVKEALGSIHAEFATAMQNPFQSPEEEIISRRFKVNVENILQKLL